MADLSFSWPEPVRDADIDVPVADAVPEFLDETEWMESSDEMAEVVHIHDERDDWDGEVLQLHAQLAEAENTIASLETDRAAARKRIEQLEAAEEWAQAVITQQRRRLLLLERQVENTETPVPVPAGARRTSLLDRLLGGVGTPVTADA